MNYEERPTEVGRKGRHAPDSGPAWSSRRLYDTRYLVEVWRGLGFRATVRVLRRSVRRRPQAGLSWSEPPIQSADDELMELADRLVWPE